MLKGTFFAALFALLIAGPAYAMDPDSDPEALADLRIAEGSNDIAAAWLIAPTGRYRHFVLGSDYEAGGLRAVLRNGRVLTLMLDADRVFEDRQPRLADLDGDGHDEIVLVLSSLTEGASLAVYGIENGEIALKAQTPHIGQPFRWLNPAGIADFDGDGALDVALVTMPHLVKRLEFWTLAGGTLSRWAAFEGYSNHRLGSMHTGMSAVSDYDGDGIPDLALPAADRSSVAYLSLAGRQLELLKSVPLPAPADGTFVLEGDANRYSITTRLEDGTHIKLH